MHHILQYMVTHTVRDDAISQHVIEHNMLLHTRDQGQNIYSWSLSFAPNRRRHLHATKADMTPAQDLMYVKLVFVSQITTNELESITSLSADYPRITEGILHFTDLSTLLA